jgi:Flp pilus assembly protein TadG
MTITPRKDESVKQARTKRRRGSALVETALIFTTAISMILFIVDMGRILLWQQFIAERARIGARNAVVNNWDSTAVQNYVVYGSTTAPDSDNGTPAGYLGLLPSQVTLTKFADSGIGDRRYQVKVSGVPILTWIPYMSGQYTLPTVTATMPVESQGATN